MRRSVTAAACALMLCLRATAAEPTVTIKPSQTQGSRTVEKQTETAVLRDYLESWKTLDAALNNNSAEQVDVYFVGTALTKINNTISGQTASGIHTHYIEHSHNLQIVFYSPEGLSIQVVDNVEYEEQVFSGDKLLASKSIKRRYLAVLTPSEVRWRVRILQSDPA